MRTFITLKGGQITSVEENKALRRRLYKEVHNKGDLAAVDELLSTDFVDHNPPDPGITPGPEGVKQTFAMFRAAFPDLHTTVEDMVAEGDKVVARLTIRGTHKGEFLGGILSIESRPGLGTKIAVEIPINQEVSDG